MSDIRQLVTALVLLLCALVLLYLFTLIDVPRPSSIPRLTVGAEAPTMPTGESAQIARSPQSFDAFVSVTVRGFEPADITVGKGKTVRFTNNSGAGIRINATGDAPYPGGAGACAHSAFDSCAVLAPGEFWEFTFDAQGVWQYRDGESGKEGVVRVK